MRLVCATRGLCGQISTESKWGGLVNHNTPPTNLHEYQKKGVTEFAFCKHMKTKELDEGKQIGGRG